MGLQQPSAKPGLERVKRVARDRLLNLRDQEIVVAHDEIADRLALIGRGMKLGRGQPRRGTGQLDDRAAEGRARSETCASADDARAADGGGLDDCSALHHGDQRDHAGMRKIDMLDLLSHLLQPHVAVERHRAQMRRQH